MANANAGDGTVAKALEVLDRVAGYGRPVRFSELLDDSPYPKATLYRLVQTLTRQGMLSFDTERQCYAPGMRLVRLAHAAWQQSSLAPIARPHVDALARDVGETVHLAQLDNAQVLYVDKRNATSPIEMYSSAGRVGPAYCTGVGKAMMAYLPDAELDDVIGQQSFHKFTDTTITTPARLRDELGEIRSHGYGFDREEHEPGIICIALPVLAQSGRALGALSVTSSTDRHTLASLERLVPRVSEAATAIGGDAQHWRFPDQEQLTEEAGTR